MLGRIAAGGVAVALGGCAVVIGPCEVNARVYSCAAGGVLLVVVAPGRGVIEVSDDGVTVRKEPGPPAPRGP